MSSYKELLAQRELLDKQIKEAVQREKADGIAKAKAIIEQYDLSASDLFSRKAGSKGGSGRWPVGRQRLLVQTDRGK